ncbi:MAG: DUF4255 domain-containing protein [Anaerolineales bacterium]|nr:DUF4255 domain-containing protein [Anaerolineales bacterium]
MIHDLDKTVEVLLKQELIDFKDLEISFATPDNEFAPNGFAVNLFLYDVRENRELRSNELYVERQLGGAITKRHSPVRVDCSYLITAHAKGQNPQGEHRLLGAVMKALLRYPTLPPEVLQGELREKKTAEQDFPLPTAILQPGRLQSVGEFWQAMQGKPRAALNYTITISVAAHEPVTAGTPVGVRSRT